MGILGGTVFGACGGAEFTGPSDGSGGRAGASGSGGAAAGSAGSGASAGSGGTAVLPCRGPDECNDDDPCTIDECVQNGCMHSPKCGDEQVCCDGLCGECCQNADCNDDIACTLEECIDGLCAVIPDDDNCAVTQYCKVEEGCVEREPCPLGTALECDDGNPCTTDTCVEMLCHHETCPDGGTCCEGGCAACCADNHCSGQDADPCTSNTCTLGTCTVEPFCESGMCCPAAEEEGQPTCGACCSQKDCVDEYDCTIDSCTSEGCTHVPDDTQCPVGQVCTVDRGCLSNSGCPAECLDGEVCCGGVCQQCCTPSDCPSIVLDMQAPVPGVSCGVSECVEGKCVSSTETCTYEQTCCSPYGCFVGSCPIAQ